MAEKHPCPRSAGPPLIIVGASARAFAQSEPNAKVLLCAVELCSLHFHYGWEPDKIVANAPLSEDNFFMVPKVVE